MTFIQKKGGNYLRKDIWNVLGNEILLITLCNKNRSTFWTGGLKMVSESFFNADHEFEVKKNIPNEVNPLIHFNPLIRHFTWISRFWPKYIR